MASPTWKQLAARASTGLLAGALLAAGASASYQLIGDFRDRRRFPPPGCMVAMPGGERHVWAAGQGSPTVVIVACLGGPAIMWTRVQRMLEKQVEVVLYDRRGLGWSTARPGCSRSAGDMTDELHELLTAAAVSRPVVLVGHSVGGLVARLYATRHPDNVAAVVLVDSSHEDMYARLHAADPQRRLRPRWGSAWRIRTRWLGLRRLGYDLGLRPSVRQAEQQDVPEDLVDAAVAIGLGSRTRRGDAAEMAGLSRGAREVREQARHLGNLPLTVISGGVGPSVERRRWHSTWLELQAELTEQSTNARQVMAMHAGHHVQRDDPELVAAEVLATVEQVRGRRR